MKLGKSLYHRHRFPQDMIRHAAKREANLRVQRTTAWIWNGPFATCLCMLVDMA